MNLPWSAAAGGALIGAAAVLLLATIGRVAGISGITAGSLRAGKGERAGAGPSGRPDRIGGAGAVVAIGARGIAACAAA